MSPRVASLADLSVRWTDPRLDAPLRHVVAAGARQHGARLPVSLTTLAGPAAVPDGAEACFSDETRALVWRDWTVVSDTRSAVWVSPGGHTVDVRLSEDSAHAPERFGGVVCLLAFSLAARQRGRFHVHAAAVVLDRRPVLIAGDSGAGKTTLAVALAVAGAGWGGDDTAYLMKSGTRIVAYPVSRPFHIRPQTRAMFPAIGPHTEAIPGDGSGRFALEPERMFGAPAWTDGRAPRVLLFPVVSRDAVTVVRPIASADALGLLLTASALVMVDLVPGAGEHLDALRRLADQAAAFEIRLGRDAIEDPSAAVQAIRCALAAVS